MVQESFEIFICFANFQQRKWENWEKVGKNEEKLEFYSAKSTNFANFIVKF
jgi:hypothetical protein